jgi:hypothetical protein
VLRLLNPAVGPLPSETDGPKQPISYPRLATTTPALDWYREPMRRVADVPGLLDDDVRAIVTASVPTVRGWLGETHGQPWLGSIAALGLWLLDHDAQLGEVRPPWA